MSTDPQSPSLHATTLPGDSDCDPKKPQGPVHQPPSARRDASHPRAVLPLPRWGD